MFSHSRLISHGLIIPGFLSKLRRWSMMLHTCHLFATNSHFPKLMYDMLNHHPCNKVCQRRRTGSQDPAWDLAVLIVRYICNGYIWPKQYHVEALSLTHTLLHSLKSSLPRILTWHPGTLRNAKVSWKKVATSKTTTSGASKKPKGRKVPKDPENPDGDDAEPSSHKSPKIPKAHWTLWSNYLPFVFHACDQIRLAAMKISYLFRSLRRRKMPARSRRSELMTWNANGNHLSMGKCLWC